MKNTWAHGDSPTILEIKMDADRCENKKRKTKTSSMNYLSWFEMILL